MKNIAETPWVFGYTFDTAFLKDSAPATMVHSFVSRAFGLKKCIEAALIAAEAGAVEFGEEVIAVAGTGWLGGGADAAVVLRAAPIYDGAFLKNENGLFGALCMPRVKFSQRPIATVRKARKGEPM